MTDAELIRHVRTSPADDERHNAFMAIYYRYLNDVAAVCGALLREMDSAQDAVQDTFTAAYDDLCHKDPDIRDLRSWLRGIASNRCYPYMRGGSPGQGHRPGPDMLLTDDQLPDSLPDLDADIEGTAVTVALRADAEQLVAMVTATFTERQQRIYQLSIGEQLRGKALGARLGVSAAQAARLTHEITELVMDGIGALVLARAGRTHCPALAKILDQAAWNGANFDARLRERIVRHFDTCPTCDRCSKCAAKQKELGKQLIPVLIPLLFAGELRDRLEAAIGKATSQEPASPHDPGSPPSMPSGQIRGHPAGTPGKTKPPRPPERSSGAPRGRRRISHAGTRLTPALWATATLIVVIILVITVVIARKPGAGGRPGAGALKAVTAALTSCKQLNKVSFSTSVPRRLTLPRSMALPPGAALYGTRFGDGTTADIIGPSDQTCDTVNGSGADGTTYLDTHTATSTAPSVFEFQFVGGGIDNETHFACPYIPEMHRLYAAVGGSDSAPCSPEPGEIISQIPSGTQSVYIAAVKIPASTADESFATSGYGSPVDGLVADVIKTSGGQRYVWSVEEIDCKVSGGSARICQAALDFFFASPDLTQATVPQSMTSRARSLAVRAINKFFQFSPAGTKQ